MKKNTRVVSLDTGSRTPFPETILPSNKKKCLNVSLGCSSDELVITSFQSLPFHSLSLSGWYFNNTHSKVWVWVLSCQTLLREKEQSQFYFLIIAQWVLCCVYRWQRQLALFTLYFGSSLLWWPLWEYSKLCVPSSCRPYFFYFPCCPLTELVFRPLFSLVFPRLASLDDEHVNQKLFWQEKAATASACQSRLLRFSLLPLPSFSPLAQAVTESLHTKARQTCHGELFCPNPSQFMLVSCLEFFAFLLNEGLALIALFNLSFSFFFLGV